jgi:hypothetical protein
MKRAKFLNLFVTSVLLATVAAGCKKTPKNITPITNPNLRPPGSEGPANALGTQNLGNQIPAGPGIRDLNPGATGSEIASPLENANEDRAVLADKTIHFDYDR